MKKTYIHLLAFCALSLVYVSNANALIYTIPKDKDVHVKLGNYPDNELDPSNIHLLVWNIYKGEESSWPIDYSRLARGKDLILIQEMFLDRRMRMVFQMTPYLSYETATSFIYNDGNIRTGVATASTAKPKRLIWRRSPDTEPVISTPKMGLITVYPLQDREEDLMVANIHAINFVGTAVLKRQLEDLAAQMKNFDGPLIFAGDFNTWSPSKVAAMYKVTKNLELDEVIFPEDERKKVFNHYIDYIFTRGIGVQYAETHGNLGGSDHVAMSAELYIQEDESEALAATKEASPQAREL